MTKFQNFLAMGLASLAGALLLIAAFYTPKSDAVVYNQGSVPQAWADASGSNSFGFNASAVPVVIHSGVLSTGITTNAALSGSFTLTIVNGLVVGTQ